MKNEAELLIDKLMNYYNVFTISDLATNLNTSQPAISQWKKKNYVKAIKKKCRELGIYNEIFGDINTQTIINNNGQAAQKVDGDQKFNESSDAQKNNKIDTATYNLFQEAYDKAIKNDDLNGLRIHLMDY